MVGKGFNVFNELSLTTSGGGTAYAPIEGNDEATVVSLVGANLKQLIFDNAVESCPMIVGKTIVEFTDHRGHTGNPVPLLVKQSFDAGKDIAIVQAFGCGVDRSGQGREHPSFSWVKAEIPYKSLR